MTDYTSRGVADATTARASSAVSWGAVLGGAVVSASISLMLLAAGAGLGFTSISPWTNAGVTATTFGIAAVIWLAIIQLISAGAGGYLAGRLRTKRVGLHTNEVAFRDTAHGFLAWAVGSIVGAVLLASTASAIIGGTARLGATAASGVGSAVSSAASQVAGRVELSNLDPSAYLTDTLFRTDRPAPSSTDAAPARAEVGRIIAMSIRNGEITPADKAYVTNVIAAQTGISQPDAEKRINDAIAKAKETAAKAEQTARETADAARKGAASLALATFIAMLMGALASSYGGTVGGRARDKFDV
ncbi:hypothetical protein DWF00_28455 [Bosea caraganae]|uniref:PhnA-like protein n=1 Tax=Bosea caraganae TaxID=2763117 RepID=A0A370L2V0_9HYPH|nr:hypothetical protein [Bosea caraganae]RDJ20874.1 hypothetical protein DWF00_28455 [Bosea caraganae]RDJ22593.1 hypothetical protein DWE98_19370 [Bosea caraganae]